MADYRVLSLDLRTGTRIAEIELSGLNFTAALNDVGTVSGVVKLPAPTSAANRARAAVLNDAVDESRRHLIVERDGVIVADGIVWLAPYDDADQSRQVQAASTWSYFRRRHISYRSVFSAFDQVQIAQNIVNSAQLVSGGDIGVTFAGDTCPVTRDRTYERFELKQVAEAVEQLAAVEDGFDFAIDCSWDPATGDLVKLFRAVYPRLGRSYTQTGLVFEVGRNVTSWTWPTDGTKTANRVWAAGAGEGDSMLLTSATDATQIQPVSSGGPGYPLLEDVVTNKDVSVRSTLIAQARARLAAKSRPVVLPEITVRADLDPVFGSYIVGDACRFIIPPNVSPRWPDGVDTYRRIVGWAVSVSDDGEEEVTLTLGEEPGSA